MGCDIHAHIDYEYSFYNGDYAPIMSLASDVDIDRDYYLFALLAGVRGSGAVFNPRGIPQRISSNTMREYGIYVVDTPIRGCNECTREAAEAWVTSGSSTYMNERKTVVSNPDWHTASWLYVDELKQVFEKYKENGDRVNILQLRAIIATMEIVNETDPTRTKLVFWFDN